MTSSEIAKQIQRGDVILEYIRGTWPQMNFTKTSTSKDCWLFRPRTSDFYHPSIKVVKRKEKWEVTVTLDNPLHMEARNIHASRDEYQTAIDEVMLDVFDLVECHARELYEKFKKNHEFMELLVPKEKL